MNRTYLENIIHKIFNNSERIQLMMTHQERALQEILQLYRNGVIRFNYEINTSPNLPEFFTKYYPDLLEKKSRHYRIDYREFKILTNIEKEDNKNHLNLNQFHLTSKNIQEFTIKVMKNQDELA
jgi:hypothetical protein